MVTPHEEYPQLAEALGVSSLYFKREDKHPYGSHKGRSIPIMIDTYLSEGIKHFALSSSGNSALAAALYIKKINSKKPEDQKITLDILIGKNIKPHKMNKLEDLKDEHILISLQERPLQTLFIKTQDDSIRGLRQSTDDTALIGYNALAEELLEIKDLRAVFIGTSSGTTAQALAEYFDKHGKKIEVHVVQTSSCHPIAGVFVDSEATEEKSIADAIVDHVAARKEALTSLLEKTNGNGWIARNEQISIAQELTEKHAKIVISPNSALSVAGVMEASYTGKTWDGSVVCLICGE
jgi:threonine dehydratase